MCRLAPLPKAVPNSRDAMTSQGIFQRHGLCCVFYSILRTFSDLPVMTKSNSTWNDLNKWVKLYLVDMLSISMKQLELSLKYPSCTL